MNFFDKFTTTFTSDDYDPTPISIRLRAINSLAAYARYKGDIVITPTTNKTNNYLKSLVQSKQAFCTDLDDDYPFYAVSPDVLAYMKLSHISDYIAY